jgi:HK97 family phage major capsid protein
MRDPSDLEGLRTLEEYVAYQNDLRTRQQELDAEFAGKPFTDDARSEWATNDEIDTKVDKIIAELSARRDRVAQLAGDERNTESVTYTPPTIVRRPSETDIFDVYGTERAARSPEERDQKLRDNAMRAVEIIRSPSGDAWQERMTRLLDESDSADKELARLTLRTGSPQYRRAFNTYVKTGGQERGTALAVGVDGTGGYSVPVAFDPTILPIGAHSFNPFRQLCRTVQITGTDTWQALTATAVTAAYGTEAVTADEQGPTFARPEFIVHRAFAFVTASYEMMQDRSDLAAELGTLFSEAKDNVEENKMAVGAAGSTNPVGMFVDGQYTAVTTAANPFAVADLTTTEAALPIRYRPNAAWFLSRAGIRTIQGWETSYGQLFNSQLGYPNAGGLDRANQGPTSMRLLGYPVVEVPSGTFSTTVAGTISGVLVDPSRYVIVDRVGMSVRVIPDMLSGATPNFPTGQSGIYAFWRNTAGPINVDAGRQIKVHA